MHEKWTNQSFEQTTDSQMEFRCYPIFEISSDMQPQARAFRTRFNLRLCNYQTPEASRRHCVLPKPTSVGVFRMPVLMSGGKILSHSF